MSANLILGIAGSVVTLGLLFELLRRQKLREKYAAFWVLVAVGTLVVAAVPQVLFWSADVIGVEVPSNLLFFVASMVLMVISVQHSLELGRLEERTRALAEEVSMLAMRLDSDPDRAKSTAGHEPPGGP